MATMLLIRDDENANADNVKGKLKLFNSSGSLIYECYTLELPWKDNRRSISCIPSGTYDVKLHESPSLGEVLEIQDVEERKYIYFHVGNFVSGDGGRNQVRGCILVGDGYEDLNYDGIEDITNSRNTFNKLLSFMDHNVHTLEITDDF